LRSDRGFHRAFERKISIQSIHRGVENKVAVQALFKMMLDLPFHCLGKTTL
jgi:hypothetical protein